MIYQSSPIKRKRRTRQQISTIKAELYNLLFEENPMTVRQVFYRMVSKQVIDKTENEYQTIVRLSGDMRRKGELDFAWLADSTRWMRKPDTYSSLENMLRYTAQTYRRSVWDNQDAYVEIWLEKEALAGVLYAETDKWDVPLMVTRGYPSLSYLHSAAETIAGQAERGKTTHIYYFGDLDPSGLDIPRKVEQDLREFAPYADLEFARVAITTEQVAALNLQTRPTKKTDSRAKNFTGESVEVDAIMPAMLRRMVSDCITPHIDHEAYQNLLYAEKGEREALMSMLPKAA